MLENEELYLETRAEQWERSLGLTRTELLKLGAALPLATGLSRVVPAGVARAATRADSPIVKQLPPEWFVNFGTNAEMRWDAVPGLGYTTPNERFFVRDHTATPVIDAATWRLRVSGSGSQGRRAPNSAYEQLHRLPATTTMTRSSSAQATDAASSRASRGRRRRDAVGTAGRSASPGGEASACPRCWSARASSRSAVDVLPVGLDATRDHRRGRLRTRTPAHSPSRRRSTTCLLAYEMNGEPLPPDHGFPLRLVVPGWIGIASIKWVGQIEVSDQPLYSPWNTKWYRMTGGDYPADSPPITMQVVKSAFELAQGAELPAHRPVSIAGRAWSGTSAIRRVEVSIDEGATWQHARLRGPNAPGAWARWHVHVPAKRPGAYELWARATDKDGRAQPPTTPFNENGYLFGAVVRHPVVVR